jgi:hypothetical protein
VPICLNLDEGNEVGQGTLTKRLLCSALLLTFAGCAPVREDASPATVRHLFTQSPQRAGACFARNAEAHSSALVAEVPPPDARGNVEVIVRVRNGVTYATADLRPVGQRTEGTITLMTISSARMAELVRSLVEGC